LNMHESLAICGITAALILNCGSLIFIFCYLRK
jgi:hypothetical protein